MDSTAAWSGCRQLASEASAPLPLHTGFQKELEPQTGTLHSFQGGVERGGSYAKPPARWEGVSTGKEEDGGMMRTGPLM